MPREFISSPCLGDRSHDDEAIVISLYGPRGGSRACEAFTLDQAVELARQLNSVLEKVQGA